MIENTIEIAEAVGALRALNGFQLANLAEVNAGHGAGFDMLDAVRLGVIDAVVNGDLLEARYPEDTLTEIADGAVPVYYATTFEALVELRAWAEDIDGLVENEADLATRANVCLFVVAERLARALAAEIGLSL
jgi:hypothetical protein